MAFQLGDDEMQGMNEMNLIPLIDIMLVLMIIFLVTATVLNPSVPLDLPKTSADVQQQPPKVIQISVDKDAGIYWESDPISFEQLQTRLESEAKAENQPAIYLRADKEARYETVAQILAAASGAELTKIAFVND
ncbi:ExbD/TolR family protein [Psychrobacter sp. FDAARGOS_221]|uniref:ExbD/TolR family protein n=1 Tax=Psychrobacter sp. FDAARGOS_221 TaxID=1975705 RepID=UPI000BB59B2F|nr:biopolymer transporter ExbD [Psychrobacter sp. FDAARGOS_221]PNK59826.1 biopolymer transporter ExbD [Psychrobacter sp. FDAARGOS_221]